MRRWYRSIAWTTIIGFALVLLAGCAKHERRKVVVKEEQLEGEVVEESDGEMIVE